MRFRPLETLRVSLEMLRKVPEALSGYQNKGETCENSLEEVKINIFQPPPPRKLCGHFLGPLRIRRTCGKGG